MHIISIGLADFFHYRFYRKVFLRVIKKSSSFRDLKKTEQDTRCQMVFGHALQLIAITYGMSKEEADLFIYGPYKGFFDLPTERWAAWDMIFDAPGDSRPNSPMWWRKQLELKGISVR